MTNYLTLDEIHAEELRMLLGFDEFCKEVGLRYSLAGGTLLGAVRHKGFIPWDDDVDICMPRPDWDRLVTMVGALQKETGLNLEPYTGTALSSTPFVKLINKDIAVQADSEFAQSFLWLDIIPVDGLPADGNRLAVLYARARRQRAVIMVAASTAASGHSALRRAVKTVVGPILRAIHASRFFGARLDRLARSIPYGATPYVGAVTWGMYGVGERVPFAGFESQQTIQFEGYELPCMSCWHEYLTGIYGDYMRLPPEDQRVTHGMKAWRL